jgi:hypothetical protein
LELKPIDVETFHAIVDLAHSIPDFGSGEGSPREVALYRVLRGFGARESGFLEFAIGLEAALLSGVPTELSYRFCLYGSLFLRDERDPTSTFDQLKQIYNVRSKLVHGSRIKPAERHAAEKTAEDLAKAVSARQSDTAGPRRACSTGWRCPVGPTALAERR